jgi:hypothetical protein
MFFQCCGWEKLNRRSKHNSAYIVSILSVADPGCLSRIPDPDFFPSKIPDPTTAPNEGKIFLSYPKNLSLIKNMGLGYGIRKKPFPDPGSRVKKAPDPGSSTLSIFSKI